MEQQHQGQQTLPGNVNPLDVQVQETIARWKKARTKLLFGSTGIPPLLDAFATHNMGTGIVGAGLMTIGYYCGDDIAAWGNKTFPPAARAHAWKVLKRMFTRRQRAGAAPKDELAVLAQVMGSPLDELEREDMEELEHLFTFEDEDVPSPSVKHQQPGAIFWFSDLLKTGWRPSIKEIFVGRVNGKNIFVHVADLCHVAIAGKTGGGKGSLMRLLMVQLAYLGVDLVLLNPHYQRYKPADEGYEFNEDWSPFEGINPRTGRPYLVYPPTQCAEVPDILEKLTQEVAELDRRRKEVRVEAKRLRPRFVVIDEWPAIVGEAKATIPGSNAPYLLSRLLREGRKYGIFVVVASQDFQVRTIGVDGGEVRKCFLTVFYMGGDKTTAGVLLAEPGQKLQLPEHSLGKGLVPMRCKGTGNQLAMSDSPFVDNSGVYPLLGNSTYTGLIPNAPGNGNRVPTQAAVATAARNTKDRLVDLWREGALDDEQLATLLVSRKAPIVASPVEEEEDIPGAPARPLPDVDLGQPVVAYPARRHPSSGLSPELKKAYDTYQDGYTTSRALAPILGCKKTKAAELLQELRRRKLIS